MDGHIASFNEQLIPASKGPCAANEHEWPLDCPLSGAGYQRVAGTVSCVFTRFKLPSVWSVARFILVFRRVRAEAEKGSGLIKSLLLFESPRVCYTVSLWRDDASIARFGKLASHVNAANWGLNLAHCKTRQRSEIWSVQWRLHAISDNLNWDDVDLRRVLTAQLGRPPQAISSVLESFKGRSC